MVTFLLIVLAVLVCALVVAANLLIQSTAPTGKIPPPDFGSWRRKQDPEPEQPRDYAQTSIPRTRGPWRRQMRDLQAEHNTKQKERDALFAPQSQQENPNVRKAR